MGFDGRWRSEQFGGVSRIRGPSCVGSGGRSFKFETVGTKANICLDGANVEGALSTDATSIQWNDQDVWKIVPDLCVDLNVPRGGKLGIRFVSPLPGCALATPLRIQSVQADGMIARWNAAPGREPDAVVRPGDEIVQVNNERGDILKELRAGGPLRMLVQQAPERQVVEEIAFEERRGGVVFKLHVDSRLDFHANGVLCLRGVKRLLVGAGELLISGNATDASHAETFFLHVKEGGDLEKTFQSVKALFDKSSEAMSASQSYIRPPAQPLREHSRTDDVKHVTWRFDNEQGRNNPKQAFFDDIIRQLEALPAGEQGIGVLVEVEGEEEVRYISVPSAVRSLQLKRGEVIY